MTPAESETIKLRAAALSLVAVLALGGPATAQSITGNDLLDACQDREGDYCVAFIVGTWEGLTLGASLVLYAISDHRVSAEEANAFWPVALKACLPSGVQNRQLIDVVIKYLADNPAQRHESARLLIHFAMVEAFPCEDEGHGK